MTSPNDQPQSRRAARRAEQSEELDHGSADTFAQPPGFGVARSDQGGGTPSSVPSSAPTDMLYRTQVRPRVPHYDDRIEAVAPAVVPTVAYNETPPPLAPPATSTHDGERVRRRDFRPPAGSPTGSPTPEGLTSFDAPLSYHTQLSAGQAGPVQSGPSTAPPMPHVIASEPQPFHDEVRRDAAPVDQTPTKNLPIEQTLSRRELRELRAAHDGQAAETGTEARSTTDALLAAYPDPQAETPLAGRPFAAAPVVDPPPFSQYSPMQDAPPPPPPTPRVEPALLTPVAPALEEPAPYKSSRRDPVAPVPTTGSHWSVGIHDDEDPFENTFSREVGSTTGLSTNALVLPEMPTGSIAGPVAGTGEIIITGMIEVSHLVSSTGTVPTLHDSPDLDDLFDANDREVTAPDSAPVSALKAISSHTAAHTVMTGKRSSSNTITTVLVASTVVMAVVAIGLFVIAAANGLF